MSFQDRDRRAGKTTMTIMVGCSRCGKSTWANRESEATGAAIVSRDDVRRTFGVEYDEGCEDAVRMIADYMLRALLVRGQSVIVDDTNLTVKRRRFLLQIAEKNGASVRFVVVVSPSMEEWRLRCQRDEFPREVIQRQVARLEYLTTEEKSHPSVFCTTKVHQGGQEEVQTNLSYHRL